MLVQWEMDLCEKFKGYAWNYSWTKFTFGGYKCFITIIHSYIGHVKEYLSAGHMTHMGEKKKVKNGKGH